MVVGFMIGALLPSAAITGGLVYLFFFIRKKDPEGRHMFMWKFTLAAVTVTAWCMLIFGIKWLGADSYFGFAGFRASGEDAYVPPVIEEIRPVAVQVTEAGTPEEQGPWDEFQNSLAEEMTPWEKGPSRDFIESYYVDPAGVELTFPEEKRNLIYIFLESMEVTFADRELGGAFDVNVIPRLSALSQENENFSGSYGADSLLDGGYAYNGGTWTMGAIFSQTSGLPLQTGAIGRNDMDTQEVFYPTITTIGDILEEQGYRQIFLIGSNSVFGGRRLYLENHGGYEFRDLIWAKQTGRISPGYYVWWGYEDMKLFDFARETLTELAAGDEPFNLTMLTVDTHMTSGYVCELCGDEFEDRYSNVYACSDKQVAEFIDWIKQQDFYENTTIVIVGDHPTMDGMYCRNIDPNYLRRVYTCIINSPVKPVRDAYRSYSTLDMFPTTLTALGVTIPGGRLGLGTSLYTNQRTLTEELGYSALSSSLSRYSSYLDELGSIVPTDVSGNDIFIAEDGTVTITSPDGGQAIMYPDGTQVLVSPDGSQTITSPEGIQTFVAPDGTMTVIEPDQ
ncbi:MAG: sulfatase-like hydrolase/transferase [Lachnospiraceae bacterium]|nr:sulfatase-like hydrolase/transferase [Lachnospiraceae bacterium]